MKWAGTMNVRVTRCRSTSRSHSDASNDGRITVVAPMASAVIAQPPGPAWYAGPVTMYTSSGCHPQSAIWPAMLRRAASGSGVPVPCTTPFGRPVVPDV